MTIFSSNSGLPSEYRRRCGNDEIRTTNDACTHTRKLRDQASYICSRICHCHCYICVRVACHLRPGISSVYDVRIKCSLTTPMLVDADLSYVFLHISFGTILKVCNRCTKNTATVNIHYSRPREGENARVKRSIMGLLTVRGLLNLDIGY
jgi:hypothetical protein